MTRPLRIHVPAADPPPDTRLRRLLENYHARLRASGLCQKAVEMMAAAADDFVGFVEHHDEIHPPA